MGAAQVNERAGVVPDFRQSDILRPGFAPLTTRFSDIWDGVDRLKVLVERGDHHEVATSWRRVT